MDENIQIKAAQSGDSDAFERLLDKHYDSIYRFALKWSGNFADAEDIAQLACIKLARGIHQFQFDSAFSTWLYRLVINCAKDWYRQQQRHKMADETVHLDIDDKSDALTSNSEQHEMRIYLRQVLQWVEQLGDGFKETLVLVLGEGLSHGEAASVLQVKESTVSWRIHNVRKKLSLLENKEGGL